MTVRAISSRFELTLLLTPVLTTLQPKTVLMERLDSRQPARLKTMKTDNGASYRVEVAAAEPLRCPADHEWLQKVLFENHLKAYRPDLRALASNLRVLRMLADKNTRYCR